MAFLIGGANSAAADAAYSVANSCRFNRADSPKHEKALGTSTDDKKHTFSCWFKKCENSVDSSEHGLMNSATDSNNFVNCMFHSSDTFQYFAKIGGSTAMQLKTSSLFRDHSAWYHIVVGVDTSQGVAANRVKIYVNGTQVTSWVTETYPSQDAVLDTNESGADIQIGCMRGPANYFHGYMAEIVFIDGLQYAASDFGEFDEDSPTIWKPKDVSGLTFGTNGFYMDFEDSANLGNDANGGTDLTETNLAATDQSTDNPTLNYPTLNVAMGVHANLTFVEGNLNMVIADTAYRGVPATFGAQNGKWYAEFKAVSGFSEVDMSAGIYRADNTYAQGTALGNYTTGTTWSYGATGNVRTSNGNDDTGEATFTDDDIIQVAMDLDNNKLYFGKNNAYINSGDPTSGATGTGAYAIVNAAGSKDFYHFAINTYKDSNGAGLWSANFGSPAYANSSDAADANDYGAFEFAPPSGYYAMNSANLAEFG